MSANDIDEIAEALRVRHGCHTAILYGSHARGEATSGSDFDIAGFAHRDDVRRIAGPWRSSYLDVFIYPESRLQSVDPAMLSMRPGIVLFERDGAGTRFLRELDALFDRGPDRKSAEELAGLRAWSWKMLDRTTRHDLEAHYRRAWLLTALLEDYFVLRGRWYLGPKASLRHLREQQPEVYAAFDRALQPAAALADIEQVVLHVAGPRDASSAALALFGETAPAAPGRSL